jgi:hypothetical protein
VRRDARHFLSSPRGATSVSERTLALPPACAERGRGGKGERRGEQSGSASHQQTQSCCFFSPRGAPQPDAPRTFSPTLRHPGPCVRPSSPPFEAGDCSFLSDERGFTRSSLVAQDRMRAAFLRALLPSWSDANPTASKLQLTSHIFCGIWRSCSCSAPVTRAIPPRAHKMGLMVGRHPHPSSGGGGGGRTTRAGLNRCAVAFAVAMLLSVSAGVYLESTSSAQEHVVGRARLRALWNSHVQAPAPNMQFAPPRLRFDAVGAADSITSFVAMREDDLHHEGEVGLALFTSLFCKAKATSSDDSRCGSL